MPDYTLIPKNTVLDIDLSGREPNEKEFLYLQVHSMTPIIHLLQYKHDVGYRVVGYRSIYLA